jgi:hypothetical protein
MTVGVWCSEFHHSTEYLTSGTFTTPTTARTALALSALDWSSMPARRPMYPRYRNSNTSSNVSRGSQTQYAPHMGLPQSMPVPSATTVNQAPMGAQAAAAACATFMRQMSATAAATAMVL